MKPKPGTLTYAKYRWELFRGACAITEDRIKQIIFIVARVRGQVALSQRRSVVESFDQLLKLLRALRFPVTLAQAEQVSELLDKVIVATRKPIQ